MKKKVFIGLGILVIIAAIIGMIYAGSVLNNKSKEEDSRLIELNFDELQKKIDNKETFILVLTQTDCSHCITYKPILKETLNEVDLYAYELQTNKLTKEETTKLKDIANASGTPTTIFIRDGQEISTSVRLVGSKSKSQIISRLESLGYIK